MQPWIDATQFQLRALSIGKGYSMQKYSSLQREGKNAARLEREDLRMGSDIWQCKHIGRICSIFRTMWVQF